MGIIEGIGKVYITFSENDNYSSGFQVQVGFHITSTSKAYLEYASELFTQNNIGHRTVNNKLSIRKFPDLELLLEYVERNELINKQKKREFIILKKCLKIISNNDRHTCCGIEQLQRLKIELKENRNR